MDTEIELWKLLKSKVSLVANKKGLIVKKYSKKIKNNYKRKAWEKLLQILNFRLETIISLPKNDTYFIAWNLSLFHILAFITLLFITIAYRQHKTYGQSFSKLYVMGQNSIAKQNVEDYIKISSMGCFLIFFISV